MGVLCPVRIRRCRAARSHATPLASRETSSVKASHPSGTLSRYFAGITEAVFETQLGVADPPLIDYVADMLNRFVRVEALYHIRDLTGRPLVEVADMLDEANQRMGAAPSRTPPHRRLCTVLVRRVSRGATASPRRREEGSFHRLLCPGKAGILHCEHD